MKILMLWSWSNESVEASSGQIIVADVSFVLHIVQEWKKSTTSRFSINNHSSTTIVHSLMTCTSVKMTCTITEEFIIYQTFSLQRDTRDTVSLPPSLSWNKDLAVHNSIRSSLFLSVPPSSTWLHQFSRQNFLGIFHHIFRTIFWKIVARQLVFFWIIFFRILSQIFEYVSPPKFKFKQAVIAVNSLYKYLVHPEYDRLSQYRVVVAQCRLDFQYHLEK